MNILDVMRTLARLSPGDNTLHVCDDVRVD